MNQMITQNDTEYVIGEYPQWLKEEDAKKDVGVIPLMLEVNNAEAEVHLAKKRIDDSFAAHVRRGLLEHDTDLVSSMRKIKQALAMLFPEPSSVELELAKTRLKDAFDKLYAYKKTETE